MSFFTPDQIFKTAACITPEYLKQNNITALMLDVDNTLTAHGSQQLSDEIRGWLLLMQQSGIKLTIVSNNVKKRVEPFAARLGISFVSFSVKPLPFGPARARKTLDTSKGQTALVGDQVFTDMFAAKLYGIRVLMVQPIHNDTVFTIRLKRALEKPFISRYYNKGGTLIG